MVRLAVLALWPFLLGLTLAAPAQDKRKPGPSVVISSPSATVVGTSSLSVDRFSGIPFAQQPTGSLRLKPPQSLTGDLGTVEATSTAPACPQMTSDKTKNPIPSSVAGTLIGNPLVEAATNAQEACLVLDVMRPAGTTADAQLPVLVYIFGGGFEMGSIAKYNGASLVRESVSDGKPVIFAAMNYRLGGFGFLPGAEILADGSANLGLLDQRLALQWIADNIGAFGGDPTKVTIWGESAGAISVFDQLALFDGDNSYKGAPLFRAAIMDSGSAIPADPVDGSKGQAIFDAVVAAAGNNCTSAPDKLACLRAVPYATYLAAANSVPGILSYTSVALSYLPRPDGTTLTLSPEVLVQQGKYAQVPFIIGDQEDEGTLFALFQGNLSTTADLLEYFSTVFFHDASQEQLSALLATYPDDDPSEGSPFRTGDLNQLYPQFKRLAALLGDLTFTLTRRAFLATAAVVYPQVPTWSYLSSYDHDIPLLGTYHTSDNVQVFDGVVPDYASHALRRYYYNFVYELDPNAGGGGFAEWPQWSEGQDLMWFNVTDAELLADDFRQEAGQFIADNLAILRI